MAKAKTKVSDDLICDGCGVKLSDTQGLYETAWSGVYWCGHHDCAAEIMTNECGVDKLDPNDPCNREEID